MGQALRRATSRVRASSNLQPPPPPPPPPPSSSSQLNKKVMEKPPPQPFPTVDPKTVSETDNDEIPRTKPENILEDRDAGYDAMLSQMVGRIQSKPGGKLEMGEAFVVEKYNRPMPKLRNTRPDTSHDEERPVPAGTLNVAQLRQMLLLHQGKSEDHNGPMDIDQIAQRFRIDVTQVQKVLQFVSLPPEDNSNKKQKDQNH